MEEIDLKDLLSYFLSKKIYIIVMVFLALIVGSVYTAAIQKPKYKSYTTILLTKESESTSITSTDITLNKSLVDTYREIIKSKKVINEVISNLNLKYNFSDLNNNVTVESINDTEIIKISVVDLNPVLAKEIANEIAKVFNTEVVKLYNIQNIGIVDEAEIANTPYNVSLLKQLVLSALIGLVLGFGIVFVMYYFDTSVKSTEEVEAKLVIPVIGTIPNARSDGNE